MGIGADIHPGPDPALGDDATHLDINVVLQDGIDNLDVGLDAAVFPDDGAALQVDVGIDNGVFADADGRLDIGGLRVLSLIHISEPTRLGMISYAVFCLKK